MNKEEIIKAIKAILADWKPSIDMNDKKPYLYVRNPNYDPEIEGEHPSLVINFQTLLELLENS